MTQPAADALPEQHGVNCRKVAHTGSDYLHDELDDRPYDVDDVWYCGRCHVALDALSTRLPVPK